MEFCAAAPAAAVANDCGGEGCLKGKRQGWWRTAAASSCQDACDCVGGYSHGLFACYIVYEGEEKKDWSVILWLLLVVLDRCVVFWVVRVVLLCLFLINCSSSALARLARHALRTAPSPLSPILHFPLENSRILFSFFVLWRVALLVSYDQSTTALWSSIAINQAAKNNRQIFNSASWQDVL